MNTACVSGILESIEMSGRMGTRADVLFAPGAMAAILDSAEKGASGGLAGTVETDEKGTYRVVTGTGGCDVGMYFPTEGTEATEAMVKEFRERAGNGVMVVIDPEIGELAVYLVENGECRMASALMSE